MIINLSAGQQLEIPDFDTQRLTVPASFVISIRKSGSTMVTYATQLIAKAAGLGFLDVGGLLFYANVPADALYSEDALNAMLRAGVIFSGFRDYPTIMEKKEIFASAKKVIFVRDPRDALVSEYFSNAYSHDIPAEDGGENANANLMKKLRSEALAVKIDDYVVRRAPAFVATAEKFFPAIQQNKAKIMRYEEFIFDKPALVREICCHLDIVLPDSAVNHIASSIDIRPVKENPRAFVRRVAPGDYLEKLSDGAISKLNLILCDVIKYFGYGI